MAIENGTTVAARLVTRYVGDIGKNRQEQAARVSFRSPVRFESDYVTLGRGQEKGGVENLVGYGRRNFLAPLPDVQDFAGLKAYLLDCREREARQRQPHIVARYFSEKHVR